MRSASAKIEKDYINAAYPDVDRLKCDKLQYSRFTHCPK